MHDRVILRYSLFPGESKVATFSPKRKNNISLIQFTYQLTIHLNCHSLTNMDLISIVLTTLLFFLKSFPTSSSSPTESRLITTLLDKYNKLTRPVAVEGNVVNVSIGMSLLQIVNVNEKQQILSTNIWLRTSWTDASMIWDPLVYDNISVVRFPISHLWKPDVLVYNVADREVFSSNHHLGSINANIYSTGVVLFVPPMILKTTCKMDVTMFPFDEQRCEIKLGSWTHSAVEMDLNLFSGGNGTLAFDIDDYIPNGQWALLGYKAVRNEEFYACCEEAYVSVSFSLHLKRNRMYYFFNLIVPCALIGFLAILGFTLPPDSTEKLSLGVTVLFSLIVFLNMIAESMPSNSDGVPLLGTYFNCVMFMIASSVVSTVVVNLKVRSRHPASSDVGGVVTQKLLFSLLPWMLRMEGKDEFRHPGTGLAKNTDIGRVGGGENEDVITDCRPLKREDNDGNMEDNGGLSPAKREDRKETTLNNNMKWMYAAVVVDRLCLAVSIVFTLISIVVLFVSSMY